MPEGASGVDVDRNPNMENASVYWEIASVAEFEVGDSDRHRS